MAGRGWRPAPLDNQEQQGRRPANQQDAIQRFDPAQQAPVMFMEGNVAVTERGDYDYQGDFTRAFRRWAGVPPSEFRRQRESR